MKAPAVLAVVPWVALFASAGTRGEAPAATSPTPATNAAWFSRAWQSEDGLPSSTVVGIGQSPDGFLWVATENGLVRFDGVRFREIASFHDRVIAFLVDRRGRRWLAKSAGSGDYELVCMDSGGSRVFTSEDGINVVFQLGLVEDLEGAVWCAGRGVPCRIRDGHCTSYSSGAGVPSGFGKIQLSCDGRGRLWFAQGMQVGVFRDNRFQTLLTLNAPYSALLGARSGGVWMVAGRRLLHYNGEGNPQDLGELPAGWGSAGPSFLYQDGQDRLWAGSEGAGLLLYNGAGFDAVLRPDRKVLCLTEDREGSLWVGTHGGGLVRLRFCAFELQALGSEGSAEGVRSVCQDTGGTMWAVTQSGRLARKDGPLWRVLSVADGWTEPEATCVTAAPEGGVWVGTLSNGLRFWHEGRVRAMDMQGGLASERLSALLTAPSGDIWLGTVSSNAVQQLRGGHFVTLTLLQEYGSFGSLAVDALGGVWAATFGGLLARVSDERLVEQTANTLRRYHPITSLCATPDGSLWIGYLGLGLGRLLEGQFTRFGAEQGLWDEHILQIVADGTGRLWLVSSRGLSSVMEKEFEAVAEGRQGRVRSLAYGQDEGVPPFQASSGSWPGAARSADGRLWIPTSSGVLVVDSSRLTENREPPPVVIERIVVDGELVASSESRQDSGVPGTVRSLDLRRPEARLCLAPGPRQVEFEYTGLSFVSPRNVAFKYRMQGLDPDWVEAGPRRVAYYNHLPPGDYRFEVMACNNDGAWSREAAAFSFTVRPHVWERTSVRIVGAATLLGGVAAVVWWVARARLRRRHHRQVERLELLRAAERERARIARDLHDELGSYMTRIVMLSDTEPGNSDGAAAADGALAEINRTGREVTLKMSEIVWALNPEQDSLDSFADYVGKIAHEAQGLAKIKCRLDIPHDLPAAPLSSPVRHNLLLAFREALHNVVKHAQATRVLISLRVEGGSFVLEVEDDGRGLAAAPDKAGGGHGLANMRQRLAEVEGRCEVESVPGAGVRVRFVVPLVSLK